MKKLPRTSTGFSAVEGLLVLVIVGLVSLVGWYVWHAKNTTIKTYDQASSSALSVANTKQQTYIASSWESYEVQAYGIRFKYPKGWTVESMSNPTLEMGPAYNGLKVLAGYFIKPDQIPSSFNGDAY